MDPKLCAASASSTMDCCQSPVNIMKNLDSKLVKFFHSVLRHELKEGTIYGDAVEEVIKAHCKEKTSSGNTDICFGSPATRCAYVFVFCACVASTTAYHFLQLLKQDTVLLQKVHFQDTFHLCCLGGGPGTEIAAIAKILDGLMHANCPSRRKPLLVKATVVDIDSGWSITADNLIKSLAQLVDTSLIRYELNFIESNLTEPLTRSVTDAIKEADLVTMIRFISAVQRSRFKDRCDQMLQEVCSCLKEDGTLFFMDSSSNKTIDVFRNAMESFEDVTETYGPLMNDLYKMSVFSVADSMKLNEEYFGYLGPPIMMVNDVSVWSKGKVGDPAKSLTLPTGTEDDKQLLQREKEKHVSKCLKFCFPRQSNVTDHLPECVFKDGVLFRTKSKSKRLERFVT